MGNNKIDYREKPAGKVFSLALQIFTLLEVLTDTSEFQNFGLTTQNAIPTNVIDSWYVKAVTQQIWLMSNVLGFQIMMLTSLQLSSI